MTNRDERAALGKRLREAREYRGFSQQEVAAHLGVPRTAVSQMETGNRRVEALELQRLAGLYRCSMDEFTGDQALEYTSVPLVARAVSDLSEKDRDEVIRFAEFLRSRATEGNDDEP